MNMLNELIWCISHAIIYTPKLGFVSLIDDKLNMEECWWWKVFLEGNTSAQIVKKYLVHNNEQGPCLGFPSNTFYGWL